jgi:hypothetical protein
MLCASCGVEAPTRYVAFYQNIGALVMRFQKSVQGKLCKSCIHKYFWEFTLINLVCGWWGVISFCLTPFLILNNVIRYIGCASLPPVPPGATAPRLTEEVMQRLQPHIDEIIARLNAGQQLAQVAHTIAHRAGVTPGQVMVYVDALARAARELDSMQVCNAHGSRTPSHPAPA